MSSPNRLRKKTIDSLGNEADTNLIMAALRAKLNSEATIKNAPRTIL